MPALSKEISTAVYKRDGWRCRHCNERNALHPHHVIYQSHGGSDTLNNLITLCWQCHSAHHAGKLDIQVIELIPDDLKLQFIRKRGWKPV